ncbi:hypothetical protein ABCR94_18595 [Streptomyces sp. 21So2-11]|uniref:hypothetical protein n=1 Tax=Streptomyces sp. 21So2-11 TaxID=3144408 RepID=UPI00321C2F49
MIAKIIVTLVWAACLILLNRALVDITWAQYVATFVMAGIYSLVLSKMTSTGSRIQHEG